MGVRSILCVARIHPQKNLELLCELANRNKDVDFFLIGGCSNEYSTYAEKLLKLINDIDNIIYIGAVDNPQDYMLNSDAMILTSKYEGLPMAILEAMSIGLPIISTPVGSILGVLRGVDFLADDVSLEALNLQVRKYINAEDNEISRLIFKSKERFKENYSLARFVSNNLEIYKSK